MNNPNQAPDLPVAGGIGIPQWGSGETLTQALLAGAQNTPQGPNMPPLPTEPDKSRILPMTPVTHPSSSQRPS